MGYNQFNPFQRFRETLKHEDHIHNQIEACRMAFNRGDSNEVMYAVESLMLLITPRMVDDKFDKAIAKLDEKWQMDKAAIEEDYQRQLKQSRNGCPDLVSRPFSKPNIDHFKQFFMVACSLFERKGLMLKANVEDRI